jgi:hypothetical protein
MRLRNFIAGDGNNSKFKVSAKGQGEFTGNFAALALWDEVTSRLSGWIDSGEPFRLWRRWSER